MEELEFLGEGKFKFLECTPEQQKITGSSKGRKEELEWIKRQLEYSELSEKYKLRYELKRGEVYEVDWGINVNSEFSNIHYGVVMVDSTEYNPLVIMCPLKCLEVGKRRPFDLDLGWITDFSFNRHTFAVVHQVRCLDKFRLRKIGISGHFHRRHQLEESPVMDCVYRLNEDKMNIISLAYSNILNGVMDI